jgi:membrane protein YdbS with pleckstrin-like domain
MGAVPSTFNPYIWVLTITTITSLSFAGQYIEALFKYITSSETACIAIKIPLLHGITQVLPKACFYILKAMVSLEVVTMEFVTKDFQGGKADEKMKKVWAWRWALVWLLCLWFCLGWFAVCDIFMVMVGIPPLITISLVLLSILIIAISKLWADLYWKNYSFELLDDKIVVRSGVIGRRKVMIPYERIQNVNVVKGILERIFGVSSIQIETAGGAGAGAGSGFYAAKSLAEGTIQGLIDPEPMEAFIMKRIKSGKSGAGLGDKDDNMTSAKILEELRSIRKSLGKGQDDGEVACDGGSPVITVVCPSCNSDFTLPRNSDAKTVTCPNCGVMGAIE